MREIPKGIILVSFIRRAWSAFGKLGIIIAIGLAFLFGMTGTVYLSLRSPEVQVPNILGKERQAAEDELSKAGLNMRVRATRYSAEVKPDTILLQLPRPGEVVKTGQTVAVDVSRAQAKEGEVSTSVANEQKKQEEEQKGEEGNQNEAQQQQSQGTNAGNQNANNTNNRNKNKNRNANNSNNSNNRNANNTNNRNNTNANRSPLNVNNRNTANAGAANANRNGNATNSNRRPGLTTPPFNPGSNTRP